MIEYYKRYVFWNLRMTGKVPGLKRYSTWLTKHYENHFWRTNAIFFVIGFVVNLASQLYVQGIFRNAEKRYTSDFISTLPSTADYQDPTYKPDHSAEDCFHPQHSVAPHERMPNPS